MENLVTIKQSKRVARKDIFNENPLSDESEQVFKAKTILAEATLKSILEYDLIEFTYDEKREELIAKLRIAPPEGFSIDKYILKCQERAT